MLKRYTVYAHSLPDGRMYVGITCQSLKDRWKEGHGYSTKNRMGKAIEQYGWGAFTHKTIATNLSREQAQEIERNLIEFLDLTNPDKGFNEATGGNGGGMFGKHQSEEARRRISEARKRDGFSDEHRKHISESKKGIKHHRAKPVYQFTKNGVLINVWPYMNMAAEALQICKTSISACCLGKRPSAGGYIWAYEKEGV